MKNYILLLLLIIFTTSCQHKTQSNTGTNNEVLTELPETTPDPEEQPFASIYPPQEFDLRDLTGIWIYEKCDVYGGYINGYGTDIPQKELQETFQDVVIEFYRNFICLNQNGMDYEFHAMDYEPEVWDIESFFASKLEEQETPQQIRTWFKETFGTTINDQFLVYNLPGQEYPYNRLIICPEKILMFTYGAWYASFTPSGKKEFTGDNQHRQYAAEMEFYDVWYYENKSIEDIYILLLPEHPVLEKHMPLTNLYIEGEEYDVEYNWHENKKLIINALYDGGTTSYEFKQDLKGTELTIFYSGG